MKKISKNSKFKHTEISFIPKGWEQLRLEDIVSYIKGKKPIEMIEECKENYIPYLSTEYLRENKSTKFARISNEVVLVNDEDLILLWDGSNAGEFFLGKKGVLSSTMVIFKLKGKRCVSRFLFYSLKTKENYIQGQTRGTGIPHVDCDVLNRLYIFLPSLPEQKKIAEILLSMDKNIEEINIAIEKAENLKKGLMQELLTKGIGHKDFKETEIGKIPKEWHLTELGNIVKQKKETIFPNNIESTKYIGLEHINSGDYKIRMWGNSSEVKSLKFQFKAGDILYGKLRPYLNKAVITEWEGVCSTDILVFEAKKKISNIFILYLLHHPNTLHYAISTSTGTNHPRTSWRMLLRLKVSLPPLIEQEKIAAILSVVDRRMDLLKEKKDKLKRVKKGLMNELLTGRKRVKVEA